MEQPFTYYLYSIGFPIIGLIIAIVAAYKGYEFFRHATRETRDEGPSRDQRKAAAEQKKSVQLIELYAQLFVEMARAEDGGFTPAKQEMIMDFARNRLRYEKARLEHFTKHMQKALEAPEEDLDFLLSRMARSFPYKASLFVMELMLQLQHIQEPPSQGSQRLAKAIIEALSINTDDLNILNKQFQYRREHPGVDWKEQQDASFENAEEEDMVSEDQHYKVLGLPIGSDFAAIKRAYRVLAMQYHPDHVDHLGEEFKAIADEKMRAINAAYTHFEKKFRLLQR